MPVRSGRWNTSESGLGAVARMVLHSNEFGYESPVAESVGEAPNQLGATSQETFDRLALGALQHHVRQQHRQAANNDDEVSRLLDAVGASLLTRFPLPSMQTL